MLRERDLSVAAADVDICTRGSCRLGGGTVNGLRRGLVATQAVRWVYDSNGHSWK